MAWADESECYYRTQADLLQAELDQLTDPAWLQRRIAHLTNRRDQWNRLADDIGAWARRDTNSDLFSTEAT